jgi:hypothetical protein
LCRSIKVLRKPGELATSEELNAAALQFVRKISGFHKPSRHNQEAFETAVTEIASASQRLLDSLGMKSVQTRAISPDSPCTTPESAA